MADNQSEKTKKKNDVTIKTLYGIAIALMIGIVGISLYIGIVSFSANKSDASKIFIVDAEDDFDGSTAIDPPLEMPDFTAHQSR